MHHGNMGAYERKAQHAETDCDDRIAQPLAGGMGTDQGKANDDHAKQPARDRGQLGDPSGADQQESDDHGVHDPQGEFEAGDKRLFLKQSRARVDPVDDQDRQHHRREGFTGNAQGQGRDEREGQHSVVWAGQATM